tara:strand:+ start:119 stop:1183 length:1065 start_codon:yes stop_codon:yes gene_type:complete
MQNQRKYLITGGCGFIGSSMVRNLLEKGEYVINIDKLTYASNEKSIGDINLQNYKIIKSDINEPNLIQNTLNADKPNYVIHLAAESHVDRSIDDPSNFINTNIVGTYNMIHNSYNYWKNLEKNRRDNFRFIYVSTDEVYGSLNINDQVFTEKSPFRSNSPYAASKASGDLLARAWYKTFKFPIIITNSSNNYGIWQFPEKLIPLVIKKCLKNQEIPVYGDGKQIRDWINVEDNVSGIISVIEKGKIGSSYNIGSTNEISNIELVRLICSILDSIEPKKNGSYEDLISFVKDRPAHDFRYALDVSKMRNDLGWEAKISFNKGLTETIEWYLNNRDWLLNSIENKYDGARLGIIKE